MLFGILWNCLVNNVKKSLKNRSSRSIGWQDFPELQNSLKISSARCLEKQVVFLQELQNSLKISSARYLEQQVGFSTRCPVDSTRVLVVIGFIFLDSC